LMPTGDRRRENMSVTQGSQTRGKKEKRRVFDLKPILAMAHTYTKGGSGGRGVAGVVLTKVSLVEAPKEGGGWNLGQKGEEDRRGVRMTFEVRRGGGERGTPVQVEGG